ncbi:metallophosphoesterase [Alteromonas lipotrueae]|uniref:metallophosphoesterase n=1 Tax=Alteromonas lipotrueae TaxID=2803814 RepID=UPI001C47495D|nr:metallophosphoesterase [Alteromonas lipotrueae]
MLKRAAKRIAKSVGHFLLVSFVLAIVGVGVLISQHGSIDIGDAPLAYKVGGEGPFVFFNDETQISTDDTGSDNVGADIVGTNLQGIGVEINYIRGSREENFFIEKRYVPLTDQTAVPLEVYFALEDATFTFNLKPLNTLNTKTPSVYESTAPILAMSDLEGNYKTFRDFLITHNVINENLEWQFGEGHLVLVGDMVDRGFSTTQLLWFIYKLEQEAQKAGGVVHYIIGNHELKNLQGNFKSAANKYIPIAGLIGKSQADLFSHNSYIGRWLASKNTIEKINGHLFVHGGIHEDIANLDLSLQQINNRSKAYYRQMYFPGVADKATESLISTETGLAWYRGYFKGDASNTSIQQTLDKFDARSITVGHTLQFKVNKQFNGRVFAIDVKHPNDYRGSFPTKHSEALLIEKGNFYRLTETGERIVL